MLFLEDPKSSIIFLQICRIKSLNSLCYAIHHIERESNHLFKLSYDDLLLAWYINGRYVLEPLDTVFHNFSKFCKQEYIKLIKGNL